ncbi:MAG: acetyl-CoA carboxylase biotin carboxylase subunit [Dehalococcoidia bacterium]|jgi:pyruvate carboxylase subunit A|nr:MAG: acetyl-CoA carboxylase biotin carboxylase subunit [Dehalococcoidia bacterium]
MLRKVLVANRGEIAIRIIRACREMGIGSVAVYSEADRNALFPVYADEAFYIGPARAAESYLNIPKIIQVAKECGAEAIHPGYGFLAENPHFASACEANGIKFIGPSARVIELLGNKLAARRELNKVGVPVVPGAYKSIVTFEDAALICRDIGYPVIIKPSGGGGGIGMVIASRDDEVQQALDSCRRIAASTFGLAEVYIEKYLEHPRHIEFQILGDSLGNVIHLGERECSIQRRHQKLIEESPSTALTGGLRRAMGETAVKAVKSVGYEGAGTVEFLYQGGEYYFLEVNTRVQVEHPVTEVVTGIDIVKEQIRIAAGMPLSVKQADVTLRGWAIECRINAEDPNQNFAPSPGKLKGYRSPGGIGVRVDSGVHSRYTIPHQYDPMISKLIVWGKDRDEAIARMRRALYEYIIIGVPTNIPFHKAVMENPAFVRGELGTNFIEQEKENLFSEMARIIERDRPLDERVSRIFDDKGKIAAIAVAAVLSHEENTT